MILEMKSVGNVLLPVDRHVGVRRAKRFVKLRHTYKDNLYSLLLNKNNFYITYIGLVSFKEF